MYKFYGGKFLLIKLSYKNRLMSKLVFKKQRINRYLVDYVLK